MWHVFIGEADSLPTLLFEQEYLCRLNYDMDYQLVSRKSKNLQRHLKDLDLVTYQVLKAPINSSDGEKRRGIVRQHQFPWITLSQIWITVLSISVPNKWLPKET